MAREAGRSSSPGAQGWGEGLRRLGRSDDAGAGSGHRRDLASLAVRDGAGGQFLHLRRSDSPPLKKGLRVEPQICGVLQQLRDNSPSGPRARATLDLFTPWRNLFREPYNY